MVTENPIGPRTVLRCRLLLPAIQREAIPMPHTLGFDVYGTLVDPLQLEGKLRPHIGEQAGALAQLWRRTQLEYSWRRALMRDYADFDVCTRDALIHATRQLNVVIDEQLQQELIAAYARLEPYAEVLDGLRMLRERDHTLVAFSNGTPHSLRTLLENAGVLDLLHDVVSVDEVKTFKPDPAVYEHLAGRFGGDGGDIWLVSSNYWDVMGARHAGLRAIWVQRSEQQVPDPWGLEPDAVVQDLLEVAERLPETEE